MGVILACSMAGGHFNTTRLTTTCTQNVSQTSILWGGIQASECADLDSIIRAEDIIWPWGLTIGTILFLGMPTILLKSRWKEKGISMLMGNLLRCLSCLACVICLFHQPVVAYTLSLHSCSHLLAGLKLHKTAMMGGSVWWGMRFLAVPCILVIAGVSGPPVSIVQWPKMPSSCVHCAFLAHLIGCIVPGLAMTFTDFFMACVRYMQDVPD